MAQGQLLAETYGQGGSGGASSSSSRPGKQNLLQNDDEDDEEEEAAVLGGDKVSSASKKKRVLLGNTVSEELRTAIPGFSKGMLNLIQNQVGYDSEKVGEDGEQEEEEFDENGNPKSKEKKNVMYIPPLPAEPYPYYQPAPLPGGHPPNEEHVRRLRLVR
jgi:hypothetical protein